MEVEDGKVKSLHVEPDNTGLDGMILITFQKILLMCSSVCRWESVGLI